MRPPRRLLSTWQTWTASPRSASTSASTGSLTQPLEGLFTSAHTSVFAQCGKYVNCFEACLYESVDYGGNDGRRRTTTNDRKTATMVAKMPLGTSSVNGWLRPKQFEFQNEHPNLPASPIHSPALTRSIDSSDGLFVPQSPQASSRATDTSAN